MILERQSPAASFTSAAMGEGSGGQSVGVSGGLRGNGAGKRSGHGCLNPGVRRAQQFGRRLFARRPYVQGRALRIRSRTMRRGEAKRISACFPSISRNVGDPVRDLHEIVVDGFLDVAVELAALDGREDL